MRSVAQQVFGQENLTLRETGDHPLFSKWRFNSDSICQGPRKVIFVSVKDFRLFTDCKKVKITAAPNPTAFHCTQPCRLASKPAWSANASAGLEKLFSFPQSIPTRPVQLTIALSSGRAVSHSCERFGRGACLLSESAGLG